MIRTPRLVITPLEASDAGDTITPDHAPSKRIAEKLGGRLEKHILLNSVATELYRLAR